MKRRKNFDKEYNLKYPAIILLSIFIIVILVLIVKKYNSCTSLSAITKNPFDTIEILDEKVRLRENIKTYEIETDCSNIKDKNEQIVYYRLNEEYKASKITVKTYVFSNDKLLTEDYEDVTDIEAILSITVKNKYEHVYNVKATCKQDEKKEVVEEEKTTESTNTKKNKK